MKCSAKTKISRIFVVLMLLIMAVMLKLERDKTKDMIEGTSNIINTMSAAAYVQSENAELLIRIFQRLEGVQTDEDGYGVELIDEPFDPPIKELNLGGGSNQVVSDLADIQAFASALAMNNVFQKDGIGTILKVLEDMDDIELTVEDKMFTLSDILYGEEDKVIADSNLEDFEWHYVDNRKQDDE